MAPELCYWKETCRGETGHHQKRQHMGQASLSQSAGIHIRHKNTSGHNVSQGFLYSTDGTFLSKGSSLSSTGEESIEMVMKPVTDLDLECLYVSLAPGISWGICAGDGDRCCSHFTCCTQLPQGLSRLPGEKIFPWFQHFLMVVKQRILQTCHQVKTIHTKLYIPIFIYYFKWEAYYSVTTLKHAWTIVELIGEGV